MITQRLIVFIVLILHVHTHPIVQQGNIRERRSVDLIQWQSALNLLNQLYPEKNERGKISGTPFEYRSLPGPINIEQLPAILASRYVQRYPYSSQNDPSVIGR